MTSAVHPYRVVKTTGVYPWRVENGNTGDVVECFSAKDKASYEAAVADEIHEAGVRAAIAEARSMDPSLADALALRLLRENPAQQRNADAREEVTA